MVQYPNWEIRGELSAINVESNVGWSYGISSKGKQLCVLGFFYAESIISIGLYRCSGFACVCGNCTALSTECGTMVLDI